MSKLLTTLIAVAFAAATSGAMAQTPAAPAKGDTTKSAPKGDKAKAKKSEGKKGEAKKAPAKPKGEAKKGEGKKTEGKKKAEEMKK